MSIPVLTTKLNIPPPPAKAVRRSRLTERLNESLCQNQQFGGKLTLLSAPAGFGKTTLVSEWVAGCDRRIAWLSLDKADSDLHRFLTYLVAALQRIAPDIGEGALRVLQGSQSLAVEPVLTALLNEIATLPDSFVLVLDDYHWIDARAVDEAIIFLIEHMPQQMRLVIATREDPHLPLARLRARGQLTELRASDLRFTPAEAAEFLRAMGLNLSTEDIAALEDRTEGWIAGLQLAALAVQSTLSMEGEADVSGLIRAFAGDHRYIIDYLVEEVLQRQPEPVRSFLLQTSILDRLNGALCEAVVSGLGSGDSEEEDSSSTAHSIANGQRMLENLERGNFFVLPLDGQRYWYRYHHLFADVLFARLMAEQPDRVPGLHRRASTWFEQQGLQQEAIRHALAARDFERAASLIELAIPALRQNRQEAGMLNWLKALPDEFIRSRPVLSAYYAGALLVSGQFAGVEARLQDAEQWLDPNSVGPRAGRNERVIVDQEEFRRLPGYIGVYRAALALAAGDVASTVSYARRSFDLASAEDHLVRGSAAGLLGLAAWTSGDLESAYQSYAECMASIQKAGFLADTFGCAIALADIRMVQGRLHEAMRIYEQRLQLAAEPGKPWLRGVADMHVGMSSLYREWNDLDTATEHLLRSQALGEFNGLPQNPYRWRVAMARIQEAKGYLDGALELLREAENLYVSDFFPNVRPIAALKTRVWIARGRLGEALEWARERRLSAEDELSYLREFEHITLARVMLAQYRRERADGLIQQAIGFLERLLKAAEAGERTASAVEILILQALAHQMQGDFPAALLPMERALRLAEPEGSIRTFVDEGQPMMQLLREAAARRIMPAYTGKLLAVDKLTAANKLPEAVETKRPLGKEEARPAKSGLDEPEDQPVKSMLVDPEDQPAKSTPVDPLSQRELEVLRLFKTELSGPEIAQELVIALSTVRTHTKSIYSKLNVNSRRAAVKRAAELNLF